jgi:hypothetical protein
VGKLYRRDLLFLLVLLLKRVIILHGSTGWIQKVVAEGDDIRLVRLLAKSAEKLSSF